jgi:hypothetical protein
MSFTSSRSSLPVKYEALARSDSFSVTKAHIATTLLDVMNLKTVLVMQEDAVASTEQIGEDQDGNGDKCEVMDVEPFNENATQNEHH